MVKNIKNKIIKDSFDGYKNFRLVHIVFKNNLSENNKIL